MKIAVISRKAKQLTLFVLSLAGVVGGAYHPAQGAYPGTPPLIVSSGGTGATTLTAHGMLIGEGTSPIVGMTPVADSVFVQGSATADPATAGTSATADSVLAWGAAGSTPGVLSLGSTCLNALTYTTSTHAFGCANPTQHALVIGGASGAAFSVLANVADSVVVFGATATDPTTAGTSSTADSMLGWGAAGAAPAPVSLGSTCLNALAYSTTTHAFSCANPTQHAIVVGGASGAAFSTLANVADSVVVFGAASTDPTTAGTSSTADSVLGWGAAASTPAPLALTSCSAGSSALTYNTSTHAFGCNSITGGGSVAINVLTTAGPFTLSSTYNTTNISRMSTPAAATYNLPSAVTAGNGFKGCLKDDTTNFSTNNATLKSPTAGSIDGVAGATGIVLNQARQEQCYISDGSNWFLE